MNTAEPHDNFSQVELDKFNALANRWWDPEGPQKPLHVLNPARLDYIRERTTLRGARRLRTLTHRPPATEAMHSGTVNRIASAGW